MGFKLDLTQDVIIQVEQDGETYELKHTFDLERFDIAYSRMLDGVIEDSDGDQEQAQNVIRKAPMSRMRGIYDACISAVSGYDFDGDFEDQIRVIPIEHKVMTIKPIIEKRSMKGEKAKN